MSERVVRSFLASCTRSGVASLPLVGAFLEEALFGTLEEGEAAAEAEKLYAELDALQRSADHRSLGLEAALQHLRGESILLNSVEEKLDLLLASLQGGTEPPPADFGAAIERLLVRRTGLSGLHEERLQEALDEILAPVGVIHGREVNRFRLQREFMALEPPKLARLMLAFPEALGRLPVSASRAAQVFALLRWGEGAAHPGLKEIAWAADFWNGRTEPFGKFHDGVREDPRFLPDTLLVFVHGICGDLFESWDALPVRLLRHAGIDADVLTFRYPAHLWQEASLVDAAEDLHTTLTQRCRGYTHLFFVVHSSGGLVVKRALLLGDASARPDSPICRTRRIFNITVPHCGGRRALFTAAGIVYPLVYPFLNTLARLRSWEPPIGFNRIVGELRWRHPQLIQMENDYVTRIRTLDATARPRPISVELLARSDAEIAEFEVEGPDGKTIHVRTDATQIVLRGAHGDIKIPTATTGGLIVDVIGNQLRNWPRGADIEVARAHLSALGNQDKDIDCLIGETHEAHTGHSVDPHARCSGQAAVHQWLRDAVHDGHRRILVTGDAGLGKSTILRWLTRTLAARHLSGDVTVDPLAIYIPLPQIEVPDAAVDELRKQKTSIWPLIAAQVAKRLCGITPAERPQPNEEWLRTRLASLPTVLIFDSVDEFLARNHRLRMDDLSRALLELENLYANPDAGSGVATDQLADRKRFANPDLIIVLGVRSTLPQLTELAPGERDLLYCVRRLTREDAIEFFPGIAPVFTAANEGLHDLLLTPLILHALRLAPAVVDPTKLATRSDIMEQALLAVIDGKALPRELDDEGQPISARRWLDLLTLLGWLFFSGMRAKLEPNAILAETRKLLDDWLRHLEKPGQQRPAAHLMEGFKLAAQAPAPPAGEEAFLTGDCGRHLANVLLVTVFATTTDGSFRFRHREWEDYLASRYLTQCVRFRFAEPLGLRSATMDILEWMSRQLQAEDVTGKIVEDFFEAGAAANNDILISNFVVILGNAYVPLNKPLLEDLFDRIERATPATRHAALNTFGARALRSHEKDPYAVNVRDVVHTRMTELEARGFPGLNPLTRKLFWCLQTAFQNCFQLAGPRDPWPGPEFPVDEQLQILALVHDPHAAPEEQRRKESVQIALLRIQHYPSFDPLRTISAAFYLYPVTFAFLHGVATDEVQERLPSVLMDPKVAAPFKKYALVPQIAEVWNWCEQAVARKVGGMTNDE
jgi:hypothetical protein